MKKNLFFLAVCLTQWVCAQNKGIKATPDKAVVYLNGAQLYYNQNVSVKEGIQELIFEGVAPGMDQQSLSTSGKGNFSILESRFNVAYPDTESLPKIPGKYSGKINALKDSLEDIGFQLTTLSDKRSVLEQEKFLLNGNRIIKGDTRKDSLSLLKDAMQYYRDRMNNINAELIKIKKEELLTVRVRERMNLRLAELQRLENEVNGLNRNKMQNPVQQIILTVQAEAAGNGSIAFDYFVPGAYWEPVYEVRALSGENKITLLQNATVYQNTGIDWKEVKLTLSTGNPGIGQTKPVLSPFFLDFIQLYTNKRSRMAGDVPMEMSATVTSEMRADNKEALNGVVINESANRMEYEIQNPYNIPSDNKPHQVSIRKNQLQSEFRYYGIPLSDPDAFLTARITQWEDLNLLPGNAKLYIDGSYGGVAYINPQETDDTLSLDLGRDKSLVVKRDKISKKRKSLTGSQVVTITCNIQVRNTKNAPITFDLFDRIPVSSNKEIEIKVLEKSNGKTEETTGITNWTLNLKPKETANITLKYEVKYPSGKTIQTP